MKSWSMSWPHAWLRAATGLWHTQPAAGITWPGPNTTAWPMAATSGSPIMTLTSSLFPHSKARGFAALTSSFFATLQATERPDAVHYMPKGYFMRHAASRPLDGPARCRHHSWTGLAACQIGQIRFDVPEVGRTHCGHLRRRGDRVQQKHAGVLQEHLWP